MLLKKYKGYVSGEIVRVSDEEATELVSSDVARLTFGRDYLVKPTTFNKVVTRAFKKSPNIN